MVLIVTYSLGAYLIATTVKWIDAVFAEVFGRGKTTQLRCLMVAKHYIIQVVLGRKHFKSGLFKAFNLTIAFFL
jgi:hypothetical protein